MTIDSFRPDVEGLRAIAVLLVVLNHVGVVLVGGGYVGVDVFFVLSGFLITGLLLREHETRGKVSIAGFYARRARRILPAGTLVLVLTVVVFALLVGGTRAGRVAEDARWATLFASNFRSIQEGTDYWASDLPASPLQHYWSLAIEEQFYLLWPALLIGVAALASHIPVRRKLVITLIPVIAASLAWSIYETGANGTAAYFSPFPRIWELALGALLAVVTPWLLRVPERIGVALSVVGVVAILVAAATFDEFTAFPGYAVALPVVGTALAVAGGTIAPGRGATRVLRLWPFQAVGKVSYSLYLWHWPILITAAALLGRDLTFVEGLGLAVVALGASAVTFLVVESPVRNSSTLRSRNALISVAAGLSLVVASFGLATALKATLPEPPPSVDLQAQTTSPLHL